jgi:hypothetical protein
MIWEAARATSAAPTFFKRIAIGELGQVKEQFIDAGMGCNNPTQEVLDEASAIFGEDHPLGLIISLGTGQKPVIALNEPTPFQKLLPINLVKAVAKMATDSEVLADVVARRFENISGPYFRFNAVQGVGLVALDEWKKMSEVQTHTHSYLQESHISIKLDEAVKRLNTSSNESKAAFVTLADACT